MNPPAGPAGVHRDAPGPARRPADFGRSLAVLAAILVVAAGTLRGLDALPGFLTGHPRGVFAASSLEEAERVLGARIWLPAFFPDSLRWPPRSMIIYAGPPAAVAVTFPAAGAIGASLVVCQTVEDAEALPRQVLPSGLTLQTGRIRLRGMDAWLAHVQLDDGRLVYDVAWHEAGRLVALRYEGSSDLLLKFANSLRTHRP